jgi:hypothetical protein
MAPTVGGADVRADTVAWLLEGDPSIRWQVLRDLAGAPRAEVEAERARTATSGWGRDLLQLQDAEGLWGGGLYSPKWTSTTYTLLLLHWLGLPPGDERALLACHRLWDGAVFHGGGLTLTRTVREPETCITSMLVLLAASLGLDDDRVDPTVEWLVGQQLHDGGWNCESVRSGSHHGSFHTSISVLDALSAYESANGAVGVGEAMEAGREFFLEHSLYRSHRTGRVVDPAFTRFPFPPQWHFDVLRGLEHFCFADAPRDERLADAITVIREARRSGGRWLVQRSHPGRYWFRLEAPGASRWATLRALRVLEWWDGRPERGPQGEFANPTGAVPLGTADPVTATAHRASGRAGSGRPAEQCFTERDTPEKDTGRDERNCQGPERMPS